MGIEPRLWVLSTCSLVPDTCNQTKEFLLAAVVGYGFPLQLSREKTKRTAHKVYVLYLLGLSLLLCLVLQQKMSAAEL